MPTNKLQWPPPDTFRKRLCPECMDDLEHMGYLTNPEKGTMERGVCERCGKNRPITRIYRYTLSCKERARRGMD